MLPRQVFGRDRLGLDTLLLGPKCTAVWGQVADGSQRDGWEDGLVHAFELSYSYLEGTLTFNEWSVFREGKSFGPLSSQLLHLSFGKCRKFQLLPDGDSLTDTP